MVTCPKCQRPMLKLSGSFFACMKCNLAAGLDTLEWLRTVLTAARVQASRTDSDDDGYPD
jgi:endogenous inhibitor of DNA gyrase (YacG/DUF329 family)